ncbi:MAG: hypothetical protein H7Y38_07500 [Armatimonadetes bacterium]|nr:hypothetical protein [Armatimonadota bacterium]
MTPYQFALTVGETSGMRLEISGGIPTWEAFPVARHQMTVDRIRASIKPFATSGTDCACLHLADVYVAFPDGSLKRPDIAVFSTTALELDSAITVIPVLRVRPRFPIPSGVSVVCITALFPDCSTERCTTASK